MINNFLWFIKEGFRSKEDKRNIIKVSGINDFGLIKTKNFTDCLIL